ncbi:MAG: copper-binding protein [Burkholderiaceae bacterium]|nr:copper-binding protein [Burkholderiaceae bacterium]
MTFSRTCSTLVALGLSAVLSGGAWAQSAEPLTDGQVKKMDPKAQTITLAHGPIKNLDMPAMTMVFKARTPALFGKVKVGDKVKFHAEMPNGALTVTAIALAK